MRLNLKIARIKKGLKQREVAEQIGVTRDYIASLESGRIKNPSIENMKKLSEVLDAPVTELFFDENDDNE